MAGVMLAELPLPEALGARDQNGRLVARRCGAEATRAVRHLSVRSVTKHDTTRHRRVNGRRHRKQRAPRLAKRDDETRPALHVATPPGLSRPLWSPALLHLRIRAKARGSRLFPVSRQVHEERRMEPRECSSREGLPRAGEVADSLHKANTPPASGVNGYDPLWHYFRRECVRVASFGAGVTGDEVLVVEAGVLGGGLVVVAVIALGAAILGSRGGRRPGSVP